MRRHLLAATALTLVPALAGASEITFAPVPFARTDAEKRAVTASASAEIDGKKVDLGYHILARSGDKLGDHVFGALVDRQGKVVKSDDGADQISVDADFTSLLRVDGKLYSVTHFESRPGAMYLTQVEQAGDGTLKAVSTRPIDFSGLGGLWVPCAGSVTPWETHLGSEEYPADARAIEAATALDQIDDYIKPMVRYEGLNPRTMTLAEFKQAYRPYRFGYPVEVTVTGAGEATPAKHYSMGRVAVELANVMPDRKTVYISDDGTNVGLFMYKADVAGDLSAGTLYAAKWTQTSAEGAGAADISWVDLGHADDASVRKAIEGGATFSDLFDTAKIGEDGSCPEGFKGSNAEGAAECLKVRPGMEMAASRLETRRYASMMGATTEFRKMEGSTLNPATHTLYLSMSAIEKGMEKDAKKGKYELGGRNDIQLTANKCGAVYALTLDAEFRATKMEGLVAGKPAKYAANSEFAGNTCDVDGIANPDNITYMPGYDTLVIGEDTGSGHQNDAVWAYNLNAKSLTRILSTPYGSETTSVYWYPNLNGHGYLMGVVQHPYGESDEDKLTEAGQARAYVGYVGPFPAMDAKTN
ncbi:PhoX family protein [Acidimangrovimonas sediminis]|uniref:PhoX family protein n=1 Tax=Acidimangrovimonas sediminis TaxID=2056283 RepID=UPI000C7FC0C8|nr:alkaline phosphatase PhoX [Acidimangrovimonas sediminis]